MCNNYSPKDKDQNRNFFSSTKDNLKIINYVDFFFSSSIRIQLELPILDLTISNLPNPVTADVEYEVLCQVSGSQPPSEVTWRLGEVVLPTEGEPRLTHDNNLTTSTLYFMPKIKDQART